MDKEKYGFVYETTNTINGMKYIGKCIYGRKNNNWETYLGSGIYLKRAIKKYGRGVFVRRILDEAMSEEELKKLEEYYIDKFNAVQSPTYYNISPNAEGGDLFTTHPRKEEIRKMRVEQMTGEGNHQYGRPKTDKMIKAVKEANSRRIVVDGVEYRSQREACKSLGIKDTTLSYRLDSPNYPTYQRIDPRNKQPKGGDYSHQFRKISIDGVTYNSMKEASEKLNIPASTVSSRVRSTKHPNYRYE